MAQIATAWSLAKVTAPIVGTTSLKNLEELAGAFCSHYLHDQLSEALSTTAAVHINLTSEEIQELEEPYGPQAIIGH